MCRWEPNIRLGLIIGLSIRFNIMLGIRFRSNITIMELWSHQHVKHAKRQFQCLARVCGTLN